MNVSSKVFSHEPYTKSATALGHAAALQVADPVAPQGLQSLAGGNTAAHSAGAQPAPAVGLQSLAGGNAAAQGAGRAWRRIMPSTSSEAY